MEGAKGFSHRQQYFVSAFLFILGRFILWLKPMLLEIMNLVFSRTAQCVHSTASSASPIGQIEHSKITDLVLTHSLSHLQKFLLLEANKSFLEPIQNRWVSMRGFAILLHYQRRRKLIAFFGKSSQTLLHRHIIMRIPLRHHFPAFTTTNSITLHYYSSSILHAKQPRPPPPSSWSSPSSSSSSASAPLPPLP